MVADRAYLGKPINRWQGFTCSDCGGSMRTLSTGRANDGKYVVRTKKCFDCGYKCVTAEVKVQGTDGLTSIESFDEEQKFARRERRRKTEGYHGIGCGHLKSVNKLEAEARIRHGGKVSCGHT